MDVVFHLRPPERLPPPPLDLPPPLKPPLDLPPPPKLPLDLPLELPLEPPTLLELEVLEGVEVLVEGLLLLVVVDCLLVVAGVDGFVVDFVLDGVFN